jgi:hypothetical protein
MVLIINIRKYNTKAAIKLNKYRDINENDIMTALPVETIDNIEPSSDAGLMTGEGFKRRNRSTRTNDKLRKFISLKIK